MRRPELRHLGDQRGLGLGRQPPGPCGSSSKDPFTGQVDYSHSYGLFQDTPACEGTFLQPTLPAGIHVHADDGRPTTSRSAPAITFYCESATSLGVSTPSGNVKGYINAVQDKTGPALRDVDLQPRLRALRLPGLHVGNQLPAGQRGRQRLHADTAVVPVARVLAHGQRDQQLHALGSGLQYVQTAITDYEMLYNKTWPYPGP